MGDQRAARSWENCPTLSLVSVTAFRCCCLAKPSVENKAQLQIIPAILEDHHVRQMSSLPPEHPSGIRGPGGRDTPILSALVLSGPRDRGQAPEPGPLCPPEGLWAFSKASFYHLQLPTFLLNGTYLTHLSLGKEMFGPSKVLGYIVMSCPQASDNLGKQQPVPIYLPQK